MSKHDQISIPRLLNKSMAPNGNSRATPRASQPPAPPSATDVPLGGDTADDGGNQRPNVSPLHPPSSSDESVEEVEEEVEEEEAEYVVDDDMDGSGGNTVETEDKAGTPSQDESVEKTASQLLLLDQASQLRNKGSLPAGRDIPEGGRILAPARYDIPPSHTPGGITRLVGVPATEEHTQGRAYTQNGYGGLEALVQMEGLTVGDLSVLADVLDDGLDPFNQVLTSRRVPLPAEDLESQVRSAGLQREMASLITEFESTGLAQRTFGTVSVVRKLLHLYRDVRAQVENSGRAVQDAVDLRQEVAQLKRDYKFQTDYWDAKVCEALAEKEYTTEQSREDIRKLMDEHVSGVSGLRKQVADLTRALEDARSHRRILEDRLKKSRFEVVDLMNFLNDNSQLCFNWARILDLMVHFRDGTPVPVNWQTVISITANDDPRAQVGPYTRLSRSHDDESKDDGPDSRGPDVDLTHDSVPTTPRTDSSKRKRTSNRRRVPGRTNKSRPKIPDSIQDFPPGWVADSNDSCLSESEPLMWTEEQARLRLKDYPIVWTKLRLDLQMLLRTGILYTGAVEWLEQDRCVHTRFHLEPLLEMLLRMMFWNRFDNTPWTKYVPRRYLALARVELDRRLESDERPAFWGPLVPPVVDQCFLEDSASEEADEIDDTHKDGDWIQGEDGDDGRDDEAFPLGDDDSPSKRTRQSPKRQRTDPENTLPEEVVPALAKAKVQTPKRTVTTALARKPFKDLTVEDKMVVEVPGPTVRSWMHNGVRVKWASPAANVPFQTLGLPDYVPNRHDMEVVKLRFDPKEVRDLFKKKPWEDLYKHRVKELMFHRRSELSQASINGLDLWNSFMCSNLRAVWMALHWLIFHLRRDGPPLRDGYDYDLAEKMYEHRAAQHESIRKRVVTKQKQLVKSGMAKSLFYEPGVWKYPSRVCYWILLDKQHFKPGTSERYTLMEQLKMVDEAEPGRAQWSYCKTDEERIAHLPASIRAKLIPAGDRDPIIEYL